MLSSRNISIIFIGCKFGFFIFVLLSLLSLLSHFSITFPCTPTRGAFCDVVGSVSYARKFHQFLVVGLIEACKGISELFPDVLGGSGGETEPGSATGGGLGNLSGSGVGSAGGAPLSAAIVSAADAYTQLQVTHTVRHRQNAAEYPTQCNILYMLGCALYKTPAPSE